jgi:hypothetical protein
MWAKGSGSFRADANGRGDDPTVRANFLKNKAADGADVRDANLHPQSGPEKTGLALEHKAEIVALLRPAAPDGRPGTGRFTLMTSNVRVAQRPRLLQIKTDATSPPALPNGAATEAFHFAIAHIECSPNAGMVAAPDILVPSLDGTAVGVLAGFPLCRRPDRLAANALV